MDQVSNFTLVKPSLEFLENDHQQLMKKISEILTKTSRFEMCQMFGEDTGSLTTEIKANFKNFQTFKAGALKNIFACKQGMNDQEKAEERKRAEEENSKRLGEESRKQAEEMQRRQAFEEQKLKEKKRGAVNCNCWQY